MDYWLELVLLLTCFLVSYYSLSGLRLEVLFRKNSTAKIQLFYILASMVMSYILVQFLLALRYPIQ